MQKGSYLTRAKEAKGAEEVANCAIDGESPHPVTALLAKVVEAKRGSHLTLEVLRLCPKHGLSSRRLLTLMADTTQDDRSVQTHGSDNGTHVPSRKVRGTKVPEK